MKIKLLLVVFLISTYCFSQKTTWTPVEKSSIIKNEFVKRSDFPSDYLVFQIDNIVLENQLKDAPDRIKSNSSNTIIQIPNSSGTLEQFRIYEFSNFEESLQNAFPNISSYVGTGIEDKSATIRISLDENGMQAMILRGNKKNEFIVPISSDFSIYAVYESQRNKGELPFTCSTEEVALSKEINHRTNNLNRSSSGELLIFRLALSSTSEYAAYFGATNSSQWNLVLAAYNATMTRVNGVFEKDFGIHMNITANSQNVAYYNASTDPYSNASNLGNWNSELQATLTSVIGEDNYDVGHLFGASGGGGNAGCIGCVCVNGSKGSGYTSPSNNAPVGDTFDIDYVAHELGHQFGGNHTFSHSVEGTGVNVEPGSGSTIMGYAGITSRDVQSNSDAYFVYASIKQVQDNMVGKTCPTRISMASLSNQIPSVDAGPDYTIPKSTPFILIGSGNDGNGDTLTYTWEENDSATSQTGANSAASAGKTGGPNWRSFTPTTSPTRYFPLLSRVIANQTTTPGLEINVEALSSVARTLNFVLTARDNFAGAGQTASDEMIVTVNGTAGPFAITAPNTAVSWTAASNQTITWNVSGTTANGVNCPSVDIYLSTDGGNTYPILLASEVPNDGSQVVTIPNNVGTNNRIMIKGNKHIFYDISNTNFSITSTTSTFSVGFNGIEGEQNKKICSGNTVDYYIDYKTFEGFSANTTFSVSGQPAGSIVSFSPTSISSNGMVTLSVSNTQIVTPGDYVLTVSGTSGGTTKTVDFYLTVINGSFSNQTLTSPSNLTVVSNSNLLLQWSTNSAATLYTLQVATDEDFTNLIVNTDVATNSYALNGLSELTNYFWKVLPKNAGCTGTYSETYRFTTEQNPCSNYNSTNIPITISSSGTPTVTSTLTVPTVNNISIADINVTVNISHTYTSDLTVTLIGPDATEVNLIVNQCGSNNNITATFDDAGSTLACGTTPAISGTIAPTQSLSAFNGLDSEGTWTLRVSDNANADGGTINSWSLNICSESIPFSCGQITTTWNGTSWSNGKPSSNVAATIDGNFTSTSDISMCSLDILGNSQVTISSGNNLEVENAININSTSNLTVENNANLIQINDVANTGNAVVERNSNSLMRLDYTIWASPLTGSQSLLDFSPDTMVGRFYNYNTSSNNYQSIPPTSQLFENGKGYLIRMPDNHPTTATVWNGEFNNGILNNGTISIGLIHTSATQNYNLIGNPYPSTINGDDFITNNSSTIFGTLYFWRKTNNAAGTAYATYTLGGATTTSPTSPTPNGIIQVGQGFIVQARNTGNPTATFTNPIRVKNNQNQFFRNDSEIEKNRIWLNLTNNNGFFHQTMIGYMTNATDEYDVLIDGKYINDDSTALSSLLNDEEYTIQLNELPFNDEDIFPMSFKSNTDGNYSIAIDHIDGLFETNNQIIYLKDNLLQAVHNLSNSAYSFSTNEGFFDNRFEIVFREQALSTIEFDQSSVIIYSNNNLISIDSGQIEMSTITIYDTLGRTINTFEKLNSTIWNTSIIPIRNQALFVKIGLSNGMIVTKKIVH